MARKGPDDAEEPDEALDGALPGDDARAADAPLPNAVAPGSGASTGGARPWRDATEDRGGPSAIHAQDAASDAEAAPYDPVPDAPVASAGVVTPAVPPARRGAAGALVLGGAVAAALGFSAAWLARPGGVASDLEARLLALEERPVAEAGLVGRLDAAETRLATVEATVADLPEQASSPDPGATDEQVAALADRLDALDARLVDIEATPPPAMPPLVPATDPGALGSLAETGPPLPAQPDLAALRDDVAAALEPRLDRADAAIDALDARLTEAEAAARASVEEAAAAREQAAEAGRRAQAEAEQARGRAALASLAAFLETGQPLGPGLADLEASGAAVPEALRAFAEDPAPTGAALREAFPEAARAGLAAAREAGLTDDGGGLGAFLRSQLAVRSVAPRTGDDPDAVLSRVEAALGQGRLSTALAEADALPGPVQDAMADWLGPARARAAADAALAGLSQPAAPDAAPTIEAVPDAATD